MNRVSRALLLPLTVFSALTLTACGTDELPPPHQPPLPPEPTYAPRPGRGVPHNAPSISDVEGRLSRPLPLPDAFKNGLDTHAQAAQLQAMIAFERVTQLEAMPEQWGRFVVDAVYLATELSGSESWKTTGTLTAPTRFEPAWRWDPEPSDRLDVRTHRVTTTFRVHAFDLAPGLESPYLENDHELAFEVENEVVSLEIKTRRKGWEIWRSVDGKSREPGTGCDWTLDAVRVSVGPNEAQSSLQQDTRAQAECGDVKADFVDEVNWQFGANAAHAYDLTWRTMNWKWSGSAGAYALSNGKLFSGYSSRDGALHTASGTVKRDRFEVGELRSEVVGALDDQKVRQAFLVGPGLRLAVGHQHASNE